MTIFEITIFGYKIAPSYYGLMYVLGFIFGHIIIKKRKILTDVQIDSIFLYIFFGLILGGRLGYILFYNFGFFCNNPIEIFKIWEGGMSFHGGLIGVITSIFIFTKVNKLGFFKIIDEIATVVPIGIFLGRIGNYLNKELLGYEGYKGLFAIEKNGYFYFPSTLIEALLEGIILFILLNIINKGKEYYSKTSGYFLILYGFFRIIVELFFRLPDPQIGYVLFGFISTGVILSIPMIIIGVFILIIARKNEIINK